MDPLFAFLIFAGLLALETAAAQSWLSIFFRIGLPIYYRRAALNPTLAADPAPALNQLFQSSPAHPSLRFKRLDAATVAMREALFENRGGFRYLPVMHSTLRLDRNRHSAVLVGYANLTVLFVIVYAISRSAADRSFIPVALLISLVLVLSYLAQMSLNNRVLAVLADLKHDLDTEQEVG